MRSRDAINVNALERIIKEKNNGALNKVMNTYGAPGLKTLIFDVFETIGIREGSPSALDGTQYDDLFVEAVIGLHEKEAERRNQLKTFLAGEAMTIKIDYVNEVDKAFTLNEELTTEREREDALKKLLQEHPEYFEFDYNEIPFLKDLSSIDSKFFDQLKDAEGLTLKEKTTLAAVATKLSNDYPKFPVGFESAGNGKVKMSFKGSGAGERLDLDKNGLPANEFDMTLNVKNLSVDGFADSNLKSVSFKNNMPDKGLIGLPLHVFQMGLMREVYEGKSTVAQPFGKSRGGWAEMAGRSENTSFTKASFLQQWSQRFMKWDASDLIPGNDVINTFLEYGTDALRSETAKGKVSNLPTSSEYHSAKNRFLNNWKDANGHSIWQVERERNEDIERDATVKKIYDEGIVSLGIDAGSTLAKNGWEFVKNQTPEWVKTDLGRFQTFLYDAYQAGIDVSYDVLTGIGEIMKMGLNVAVEGGKLVMKLGEVTIEVASRFGQALIDDIKSGKINVADWTDDVLTIALLAG